MKTKDRILSTLALMPQQSRKELALRLGLGQTTIHWAVSQLRKNGRIRIAGWRRMVGKSGGMAALFGVGAGRDACRPKPATAASKRRYALKNRKLILLRRAARKHPFSWTRLL
jgi:hypothetical protein